MSNESKSAGLQADCTCDVRVAGKTNPATSFRQ